MFLKAYYGMVFLMILSCTPLVFFIVFCLGAALSNWDLYLAVISGGSFLGFIAAYQMLELPVMKKFRKLRIQLTFTILFLSLLAYENKVLFSGAYTATLISRYYLFYMLLFTTCFATTILFQRRQKGF